MDRPCRRKQGDFKSKTCACACQVMNAELMAQKEDRSQLLEATLQEKETQLEQLTELQKVCWPRSKKQPTLHDRDRQPSMLFGS